MYSMSRAAGVYSKRFYSSNFTMQDSVEKAPEGTPSHPKYERVDWESMQRVAISGQIPVPPVLRTEERCRWQLLGDVEAAAKAGDREKLTDMNIGNYNSVIRMIAKYRDLCLLALDRCRV